MRGIIQICTQISEGKWEMWGDCEMGRCVCKYDLLVCFGKLEYKDVSISIICYKK